MARKIVLPAEGPAARLVVAGVGLKPVGVVGLDVRLEVVSARKGYRGYVSNGSRTLTTS